VATGTFDYDRRGILDETHLRFFSRRGLLRTFAAARLNVESLDYTGLPLSVFREGDEKRSSRYLSKADRFLVDLRPTFFGYQFVAVLRPKNFESHTE
jgi:hypothetical protein